MEAQSSKNKSLAENGEVHSQSDANMLRVVKAGQNIVKEEIAKHFDIKSLPSSTKSIRIVDVGCFYGLTTVHAMNNVMDAIKSKYESEGLENQVPEFEVFFNDLESNNFNALFKFLPPNRDYFAAALPASFFNPILPKQSLHVVHSSNSLNWLSEIPKEITDSSSPAWNKGKIHYTNAHKEVVKAYSAQYAKDWQSFLRARAHDVAVGGLMALFVPSVPEIHLSSETLSCSDFVIFGDCMMDMAKEGIIKEEQVDSFNLGFYFSCPRELKDIMERNVEFSIESMAKLDGLTSNGVPIEKRALILRGGLEGFFKRHFGSDEVVDEIFYGYSKKVLTSSLHLHPDTHKMTVVFILLKRKPLIN
nr:loganic acid O-methyltransferase-like [Ziziphus jujuba var. spinosa]